MTRTLSGDGTLPNGLAAGPQQGSVSFRELVLYESPKKGLLNQLFAPSEFSLFEGDQRFGEFAGGFLEMPNRRLACVKHVFDATESMSPSLYTVMEPGLDIPVFQLIKHKTFGFGKPTNMLQFISSVPNSRIWKSDRGYSIHDEPRKLLAQILINDSEIKPPEPGIALIHVREDIEARIAQELVAVLLTLTYLKS